VRPASESRAKYEADQQSSVNVSNAAVFGLQADLKLTGLQYNNCLVIFFIPYVVFEIPSNYLLKRFKPSTWLSFCMFGFGFVGIMQGLVKNYSGFLATRFFLGLFEVSRYSTTIVTVFTI
jgi:MFS family permease